MIPLYKQNKLTVPLNGHPGVPPQAALKEDSPAVILVMAVLAASISGTKISHIASLINTNLHLFDTNWSSHITFQGILPVCHLHVQYVHTP